MTSNNPVIKTLATAGRFRLHPPPSGPQVRDLLTKGAHEGLKVRMHPEHGTYVEGLSCKLVNSMEGRTRAPRRTPPPRPVGSPLKDRRPTNPVGASCFHPGRWFVQRVLNPSGS